MQILDLSYDKSVEKLLWRKRCSGEDHSLEIDQSSIVRINGEIAIVVVHNIDLSDLLGGIKRIKDFYAGSRGSGLVNEARIFGYSPRMPTRNHHDYCSVSKMGETDPFAHKTLLSWARQATEIMKKHKLERYLHQLNWLRENVLESWIMPESVFTSGVVNRSSQLAYHYDRGNIKGGWSCMFVMKDGVSGGDLCIPGLDAIICLPHGSALLFDGQSLLHGVTPMKREKLSAERFSVVYYTLDSMKSCLTPDEEIKRAQLIRTERETKWLTTRSK